MTEGILIGQGSDIKKMPYESWRTHLKHIPLNENPRFGFMTPEHHKVRCFVVRELPKLGQPITVDYISQHLGLDTNRTTKILEDLERNMFFLVRNTQGEVSWAFPMTVENTPHRLIFKSGERLYAA